MRKFLNRTSLKYYATEGLASLLALVLSTLAAVLTARVSESDALISVISAFGGTAGFLLGMTGIYCGLHWRQYLRGQRSVGRDIGSLVKSTLQGIFVMYVFRIPLQFFLQKAGVTPAIAAMVSQGLSGLAGAAVRFYQNYQNKLFGQRGANSGEKE